MNYASIFRLPDDLIFSWILLSQYYCPATSRRFLNIWKCQTILQRWELSVREIECFSFHSYRSHIHFAFRLREAWGCFNFIYFFFFHPTKDLGSFFEKVAVRTIPQNRSRRKIDNSISVPRTWKTIELEHHPRRNKK